MFGWLKRLFRRPDPLVRGLFRYHDGRYWRLADPLEAEAKLAAAGGADWTRHLSCLRATAAFTLSGNMAKVAADEQAESVRELVRVTRAGFDLHHLDTSGNGLSAVEVLDVLAEYLRFLAALRERFGPLLKPPARPATGPTEPDTGEWSPAGSSGTAAAASE